MLLLVDGQHHLTLQYVTEDSCGELWILSFSTCERVSAVLGGGKSCWFKHIELLMPFNFLLTAVKYCSTLNQTLPVARAAGQPHVTLKLSDEQLGNCGSGYGLDVFVYMLMCYNLCGCPCTSVHSVSVLPLAEEMSWDHQRWLCML